MSDPHPWDADRELTVETVRTVAKSLYPTGRDPAITALGSGWDFDAYRIGDKVVRFPRRAAVDQSLESRPDLGVHMMGLLSPLGVTVPLTRIQPSGSAFPYRVTTHPWIEGVALDRVPASMQTASHLGEILTAVHSDPGVEGQELPIEGDHMARWLAESVALVDAMKPLLGDLASPVSEWLLSEPEVPAAYGGTPRLIHNDMSPDHVLIDPVTRRVVGLIDWDDAAWGDPAHDFAVFRGAMGADFTDAMLDAYGLTVDQGLRQRIDFIARVDALDWVHESHLMGKDVTKHRRWVQNAFS